MSKEDENKFNIEIDQSANAGILWTVGWLFTIGYAKLGFWSGAAAIIIWPYFIGSHFS